MKWIGETRYEPRFDGTVRNVCSMRRTASHVARCFALARRTGCEEAPASSSGIPAAWNRPSQLPDAAVENGASGWKLGKNLGWPSVQRRFA